LIVNIELLHAGLGVEIFSQLFDQILKIFVEFGPEIGR